MLELCGRKVEEYAMASSWSKPALSACRSHNVHGRDVIAFNPVIRM